MKQNIMGKIIVLMLVVCFSFAVMTGCSVSEPPSQLPNIYETSQECIQKSLICPTTAIFPEYEDTFVEYNKRVLEDLGEGVALEYRVYDVNAYVDSQNAYGAMIRNNFHAQVYLYVDDLYSTEYGDEGVHKGIQDHCYTYLIDME